jgi:poly-beta-1,6-N-acetyl-D-glucosamine synthase
MTMFGTYALITPARNEADNLRRLAPCLAAQTVRPAAWIVVDDGSSDQTLEVARDFAAEHPWVSVLSSPGAISRSGPLATGRNSGRDILAFHAGLETLEQPVDFVVKLDADVAFAPEYFECLMRKFAEDPRLGIAGGVCYEYEGGDWRPRHVTRSHVRGATRMWRWACLQQLLPLDDRLGWDSVDELQARVLGWRSRSFPELRFDHHRAVGARDGARKSWAGQGVASYYIHYRFSYLLLRALYQARNDRAALAMISGYLGAFIRREPRYADRAVRAHLRREQSWRQLYARAREARGHA